MTARDACQAAARVEESALHDLQRARALIASSITRESPPPTLGSIELRPDQLETVRRVRAHLRSDGGCLLADDVGTGKTYVALAVARAWARPLAVVPAALRATWQSASRRAEVPCTVVTHESLSRGRLPDAEFDGIVVDESHRFRPTSRRHAALAELATRAPLLMLSATPLQNRARELAAQLALFLGEMVYSLAPARLTQWVVRTRDAAAITLPRMRPPRWIGVDADDGDVLRDILALPSPPRAAGVGDGGVLVQLSLVRAWASSRAALVAAVRRRQLTLLAVEQCMHDGRLPTRRELRSWGAGDDVQLGFPSLLASVELGEADRVALGRALESERSALDALLRSIARADDPDIARVAALARLRREHADASVLAFSESATTARAYWSLLRGAPGVGLLTAREARIASGRIGRDELLARFAPNAQGAPAPATHQRVSVLIATDLLSEGVNLQDASVVVHLDLPWNPARLAQRLGRIRRPGGAAEVASYLVSPPAHASLLLRTEERLRAKCAQAEATIGRGLDVLPALAQRHDADAGALDVGVSLDALGAPMAEAELRSEIDRRLTGWRSHICASPESGTAVGAVQAGARGWLAALDDGRLLAALDAPCLGTMPSQSPSDVARALALADGPARTATQAERASVVHCVNAWLTHEWPRRLAGLDDLESPLRRRVLRALDGAMPTVPRHRRAATFEHAARLRRALARPLPLGVERRIAALVEQRANHGAWIAEAVDIIESAPVHAHAMRSTRPPRLVAAIVFGDESAGGERRQRSTAIVSTPAISPVDGSLPSARQRISERPCRTTRTPSSDSRIASRSAS